MLYIHVKKVFDAQKTVTITNFQMHCRFTIPVVTTSTTFYIYLASSFIMDFRTASFSRQNLVRSSYRRIFFSDCQASLKRQTFLQTVLTGDLSFP